MRCMIELAIKIIWSQEPVEILDDINYLINNYLLSIYFKSQRIYKCTMSKKKVWEEIAWH
jgi:hypothetical protein